MNINDDLLVEIFDAYRVDNINPSTYPRNWWYKFAHVCQRWRRVLFASPGRLGVTLVCNSRTPVGDLLANSPPLPLIIYWGNPGTLDSEGSVKNIHVALQHYDRVCRITLRMPESSLRDVFKSMKGDFPMLETLQLHCTSVNNSHGKLSSTFGAPNLRHLQLSDFTLLPPRPLSRLLNGDTSYPSIVTFSLGEITPDLPPKRLAEYLSLMPNLKVLKIGILSLTYSPVRERDNGNQPGQQVSRPTLLAGLEELQYQGGTNYLEGLAALIGAPSLKKLSITFTNYISAVISNPTTPLHSSATTVFQNLPTLITEAWDLKFHFARVRYRDGFSIVMDHNELWTGRGAFELRFNPGRSVSEHDVKLMVEICRLLAPMPSTVQSLLLEDGESSNFDPKIDRKMWHDLLRLFNNIGTLRVARRFADDLDRSLQPDDEGRATVLTLLPKLQEIVRYGSDKEFAAFVEARRVAGSPVRVVSGPKNRLSVV
jgi:hypothetical protein